MSNTLPPPPTLKSLLAEGPVALFLDFDGTLIEIAPSPDAIEVPVSLTHTLLALDRSLHGRLALVSGRAVEDLGRHLGELAIAVAGSHGADRRLSNRSPLGKPPDPLPAAARRALAAFAAAEEFPLEAKPHGAALHFRGRPELEVRGARFAQKLAREHALLIKRGKAVVELVRPGADKGAAVRAFMSVAPFRDGRPVFVGDDVTDEDGFLAARELGGFGIAVGERSSQEANFALADTAAVHAWLHL